MVLLLVFLLVFWDFFGLFRLLFEKDLRLLCDCWVVVE